MTEMTPSPQDQESERLFPRQIHKNPQQRFPQLEPHDNSPPRKMPIADVIKAMRLIEKRKHARAFIARLGDMYSSSLKITYDDDQLLSTLEHA